MIFADHVAGAFRRSIFKTNGARTGRRIRVEESRLSRDSVNVINLTHDVGDEFVMRPGRSGRAGRRAERERGKVTRGAFAGYFREEHKRVLYEKQSECSVKTRSSRRSANLSRLYSGRLIERGPAFIMDSGLA